MYYSKQPLWFRFKKVWRYCQLYGISRTLAKVSAWRHVQNSGKATFHTQRHNEKAHVGIIGCGNFSYGNIAYFLTKYCGKVIRGVMDIDSNRAASLAAACKANYSTVSAADLINDPRINLIFIASNHASHAEYAIAALQQGKNVHIEKPHVVNEDQLRRLCNTMRMSPGNVRLGFNRPYSPFGKLIQETLAAQKGSAMFNWFIAGHELGSEHWYFKKEEGGRILGNLCHWIDFVYRLVPESNRFPVQILPLRYKTPDYNIAVNYLFGDGTIAAITFSAKGHTFEGVRERFAAQKGDAIIMLDDFKKLTIEIVDKKTVKNLLYRDHGHQAAILQSYQMATDEKKPGESIDYIWETGLLMLKTKEALETNTAREVLSYDPRILDRSTS